MIAAALAAAACSDGGARPSTATGPPRFRVAAVGVGAVDPAALDESNGVWVMAVDMVFDGLTSFDAETGTAVGAVAASWTTADQVTWSFSIDPAARFADGSVVTSHDVIASLSRVIRRRDSLPGARLDVIAGARAFREGSADAVTGLSVIDDQTVGVVTDGPFGELPALLADPGYGVISVGSLDAALPVGSGDYEVASIDQDDIVLRAVGDAPARPDVLLVAQPSVEDGYRALRDGQVDWAIMPDGTEADAGLGTAVGYPGGAAVVLEMNAGVPALGDVRVRGALAATIDREELVDALGPGRAVAWSSLVPPAAGGVACKEGCGGGGALSAAPGDTVLPPVLHLDVYDDPVMTTLGGVIARQLRTSGVEVIVRSHSFDEFKSFVAEGHHELVLLGEAGLAPSPDPYLSSAFSSDGGANLVALGDPDIDAAIAAARRTAEHTARRSAYESVESLVRATGVAVPLVALNTLAVVSRSMLTIGSGVGRAFNPDELAFVSS